MIEMMKIKVIKLSVGGCNSEIVSYFEEFVNCWGVEGKIGSVGDGEEGYDLIFEEGSEWYEKVDKNDD